MTIVFLVIIFYLLLGHTYITFEKMQPATLQPMFIHSGETSKRIIWGLLWPIAIYALIRMDINAKKMYKPRLYRVLLSRIVFYIILLYWVAQSLP